MTVATKEVQKKEAGLKERSESTRPRKVYSPAVEIVERKEDILLIADMPGADDKSVEITVKKNTLTVDHRVFNLSDEIDKDKIMATVKHGVLRLTLPKTEAVRTRKIPVRTEA